MLGLFFGDGEGQYEIFEKGVIFWYIEIR